MSDTQTATAAELLPKLAEAAEKSRELREMKPENRGDTWSHDLDESSKTIYALDAEFRAAKTAEAREKPRGPQAALDDVSGPEYRSIGDFAIQQPSIKDFIENRSGREGKYASIEIPQSVHGIEQRATLTTSPSDTASAGVWLPTSQPMAPRPREQQFRIRDLLSVVQTTYGSVPYIQELNPATYEGGASAVAEGVTKPVGDLRFVTQTATMRKLAVSQVVTDEVLDDTTQLRDYVNNRLAYMLKFREDRQILGIGEGGGIAPNLTGILDWVPPTQGATSGDVPATLADAFAKISLVDLEVDGVVMNPTDYYAMISDRHSNPLDQGLGGGPGLPYQSAPTTIWGVPIVITRSITAGTALVGAFRTGATLFDRMSTTVKVGYVNAQLTSNEQTIVVEERIGLAVHRVDAFVLATL